MWYATLTDPEHVLGVWVHHETVATTRGDAYRHGWAAAFLAGERPILERFGPEAVTPDTALTSERASTTNARLDPPLLTGEAGRLRWDLELTRCCNTSGCSGRPAPLFLFPRWTWETELLPGAQVVPVPAAAVAGAITVDGSRIELSPATRGALAHTYGRANAGKWGWLHADLGEGEVLEVVAATDRHRGLSRLPPLVFVRLRHNGTDWPGNSLLAATRFRSHLGLPNWTISGSYGALRLTAEVHLPAGRSVTVDYSDPDGRPAWCTNSELADADILLERRAGTWKTVSRWELRSTAHAEIGRRSP